MDWVKLSASYYLDPAVASLPDADAEIGFVRSLAYSGAEETHGFIPAAIAPSLFRRRRYQASVDALVSAYLWVPVSGDRVQLEGWRIARWEEWQEELEAIARRRAADRDRKRKERERLKEDQVRHPSRDMSEDSPESEKESCPSPSGRGQRGHAPARRRTREARPLADALPADLHHRYQPDDAGTCTAPGCGFPELNRRHQGAS